MLNCDPNKSFFSISRISNNKNLLYYRRSHEPIQSYRCGKIKLTGNKHDPFASESIREGGKNDVAERRSAGEDHRRHFGEKAEVASEVPLSDDRRQTLGAVFHSEIVAIWARVPPLSGVIHDHHFRWTLVYYDVAGFVEEAFAVGGVGDEGGVVGVGDVAGMRGHVGDENWRELWSRDSRKM